MPNAIPGDPVYLGSFLTNTHWYGVVGPVGGVPRHPIDHPGELAGPVRDGATLDDRPPGVNVAAGAGEVKRDLRQLLTDENHLAGRAAHEHQRVGDAVHRCGQFVSCGRQNTPQFARE